MQKTGEGTMHRRYLIVHEYKPWGQNRTDPLETECPYGGALLKGIQLSLGAAVVVLPSRKEEDRFPQRIRFF